MAAEAVINFLKTYIIDKSLLTDETIYELEGGKLKGFYTDAMFFSNLLRTENGFHFDMTTITHEKIYQMAENEVLDEVKKDFTGVSVFRYELAERKSSSKITGIMRLISSTVHEHTMEGIIYGIYDIYLGKDRLCWKEQ